MNLETLKDLVLMGTVEEKDAFVSNLKTRCIQLTDKIITVNGVDEKLFVNTENGTFFDRWMNIYRTCPHCGNIEPISNFTECTILPSARRKFDGERIRRQSEIVCNNCINSGDFVVPCDFSSTEFPYDRNQYWLYRDDPNIVRVITKNENGEQEIKYSLERFLSDEIFCEVRGWDYENNRTIPLDTSVSNVFASRSLCTNVNYPIGNFGRSFRDQDLLTSEVEAHPETWAKCSACGKIYLKSSLVDGKCANCLNVKIWSYHHWPFDRVFLHANGEEVNAHTLYFGLEIEVMGNTRNKNLIAPIQDIFHLESDSSIDNDGFEMISQPMTLAYIRENYDRIKNVLDALNNAGMKSHNTKCCGLHIHTSYQAYSSMEAVKRCGGIVNALRPEMEKFARRSNEHYCSYSDIDLLPSDADLDSLLSQSRYSAVNFTNVNNNGKDTIEYRIFRGTLNPVTLMASIEFVNNIVKMANSNKSVVRFGDLLDGEYIQKYIVERAKYNVTFDVDAVVCFGYASVINNIIALASGRIDVDSFASSIRDIVTSASEEGSVSSAVLSD